MMKNLLSSCAKEYDAIDHYLYRYIISLAFYSTRFDCSTRLEYPVFIFTVILCLISGPVLDHKTPRVKYSDNGKKQ
ncbi:MAG: hypothetical protein ACXAEU_05565 [Candidatus Hodarchaeales archaeon]